MAFWILIAALLAAVFFVGLFVGARVLLISPEELDVIWCYFNILHREPADERAVRKWARTRLSRQGLAQKFMETDEFKALSAEKQGVALANLKKLSLA